ncbi:MAG TPA: rod-binding protein, partial [Nitrosospira sp.]|nr:rod-binding protein [Nitrosospira sp.]
MAASVDLSTKFALDVQAVDGLRLASKKTGQAALEAAAKQFEALFMNMMLKSMRDATPQDSLVDSEQSRLYMSMLDQQLSQSMASRGIGLADIMIRQLRHALPPDPQPETPSSASTAPGEQGVMHASPSMTTRPNPYKLPPPGEGEVLSSSASEAARTPVALHSGAKSHALDFQARLMPHAQA